MDLGEMECGSVDWIGLTQNTEKWKALVNEVMNHQFYKMLESY
jgi:hypothetical protein